MTRTTRRGRRRLPAVTRKQCRARLRQVDHELAGAERLMSDQRARIEELEAEVGKLRAERVDAGVLRRQLTVCEAAFHEANSELLATRAELRNVTALDVPPMVRDTTGPTDQATEPIYVQTLRDEMAAREAAEATPEVKSLADAVGAR